MGKLSNLPELGLLWSSLSLALMIFKMLSISGFMFKEEELEEEEGWGAGNEKGETTRNIRK